MVFGKNNDDIMDLSGFDIYLEFMVGMFGDYLKLDKDVFEILFKYTSITREEMKENKKFVRRVMRAIKKAFRDYEPDPEDTMYIGKR